MNNGRSTLVDARGIVAFDGICPASVDASLEEELGHARRTLEAFLVAPPTEPAAVVAFLDDLMSGLDFVVGLAEHMDEMLGASTMVQGAWRTCYEAAVGARERVRSSVYGSTALYEVMASFDDDVVDRIDPADARVLEEVRRRLRKHGASLSAPARLRIEEIDRELIDRTLAFTRNADTSLAAFAILEEDEAALRGLPAWAVEQARAAAMRHGATGYRLGLEIGTVHAVLDFAEDRGLRRRIYLGHVTRAASENRPIIERILALRAERARALGYASFADLTIDGQMLDSPAAALGFLDELTRSLAPAFESETEALRAFAREHGVDELEPWDVAYFAELERRRECDFDSESTRPYLPFSRVLTVAQELTGALFAVRWERISAPAWHPSVTVWSVRLADELLATVYIDPFTRDGKREGAWMSPLVPCVPGRRPGVVVLSADIAPPWSDEEPVCLGIEEASRLFHEMGHVMHHVLSRTSRVTLSGTRVPRDFVEFPSTLLEKMTWERPVLLRMARHVKTGEPIPDALLTRCLAARRFRAASALTQRIALCVVDLALHTEPGSDAIARAATLMQRYSPAPLPPGYARIAAVSHLFGSTDGYEALLYSYIWAEVLAADGLGRLGGEWERYGAAGGVLRDDVLARGNEAAPGVLARTFFGRAPSTRALLDALGAITQPRDVAGSFHGEMHESR